MILYLSSPHDFSISLNDLLLAMFKLFFISLIISILLYLISYKRVRSLLSILTVIILFIAISYSFIIVKDYGLMNHFIFNVPENLLVTQLEKSIELLLLLITFIVMTYLTVHYQKAILKVTTVIFIMFLSYLLVNINSDTKEIIQKDMQLSSLEHEQNTTLALSKEQNILVFFLDGFSGGDLERLFQEKKSILSDYEGFVRYKNVLTVNTGTWGSIPAMFGGAKYTVEEINKRPNETLREKLKEAYSVFPNAFFPHNWALTYIYPQYAYDLDKRINNPKFSYGDYYLHSLNQRVDKHYIKQNELKKLFRISLFQTAPG